MCRNLRWLPMFCKVYNFYAELYTVMKSRWYSPYILVYKDPLLTYLFGICANYFDLKVTYLPNIFEKPPFDARIWGEV